MCFIADMTHGLLVSGDVKLSSIGRAPGKSVSPKKLEDRLCHHLSRDGLAAGIHEFVAEEGARRIRRDTLIIVDPSDVQKPYAKKMEYLSTRTAGPRSSSRRSVSRGRGSATPSSDRSSRDPERNGFVF